MAILREAHWSEARAAAHVIATRLPSELVRVDDLDGRVLGADARAMCRLPSFDSSAMDGWAVSGPSPWLIVGDVPAGDPWNRTLSRGAARAREIAAPILARTFDIVGLVRG